MANPRLTPEQLLTLHKPLFTTVVELLEKAAAGDANLMWALRRKLAKELVYLERGKTNTRVILKAAKRIEQNNLCAICHEELPPKGAELDRFKAIDGYTAENTRLVHHDCHVADQKSKNYA